MNKGREFEELVTFIERIFHNLPGAQVQHNVKLKNNKGVERQIDILITINTGRFTFNTIVECKNTKAKTKLSDIGSFKELVESVGAHQGILVSASGFQKGALKSSNDSNILLYQLSQVAELQKYLSEYRLNFYNMTHRSKDIIVRFREAKEINNNVTSKTPLYSAIIDKKVSIAEIAKDFLVRNTDGIINAMLQNSQGIIGKDSITGTAEISVEPELPLIYYENNSSSEILGFDAIIETTLSIKPLEVVNISEYKELTNNRTHALIFDYKVDNQIQEWIAAANLD